MIQMIYIWVDIQRKRFGEIFFKEFINRSTGLNLKIKYTENIEKARLRKKK